jgi:hypothetical protein
MKEQWKDIEGYLGVYQVSNLGRLRSLERECYNPRYGKFIRAGRIMKTPLHSTGYPFCTLHKDGIAKTFKVHRLVAGAFLARPSNRDYVNHKDGDKTNNNVSNLEWCTPSENMRHAHKLGLNTSLKKGAAHHKSKLTEKDVLRIRHIFKDPKNALTKKEIANQYNISDVSISYIVLRRTWKHI